MDRSLFLITKPNQLFIVLAIKKQISPTISDLSILDNFQKSVYMYDILRSESIFSNVYYIHNKFRLFFIFNTKKYNTLYTDSDVGFKNLLLFLGLKLRNRNLKICVFEEGVGTYFEPWYFYNYWKSVILKFIGVGINFGSCVFTSEIFLYKKENYRPIKKRLNVVAIGQNLTSTFNENFNLVAKLYSIDKLYDSINSKTNKADCVVILGTYFYTNEEYVQSTFNKLIEIVEKLNLISKRHLVIIKDHPSKSNHISIDYLEDAISVDPAMPAEILLWIVFKICTKISIVHCDSSVLQYFKHFSYTEYNYDFFTKQKVALSRE